MREKATRGTRDSRVNLALLSSSGVFINPGKNERLGRKNGVRLDVFSRISPIPAYSP